MFPSIAPRKISEEEFHVAVVALGPDTHIVGIGVVIFGSQVDFGIVVLVRFAGLIHWCS